MSLNKIGNELCINVDEVLYIEKKTEQYTYIYFKNGNILIVNLPYKDIMKWLCA